MKRFFIWCFCFFLLLAALLLQACSSKPPITFTSVLNIQADESGTRVIEAAADKTTLKELFHSSNFSFQSFISANCPSELEWSYTETSQTYELTFTLSFSGLEEYQEKVAAITGQGGGVAVSRPEVGVKTGFTLSENIEMTDLFSWFTDALRERASLSEAELAPYIKEGPNTLIYNGRTYPQENSRLYCYVENLLDATGIDLLTDLSLEDNTWKRRIYIHFPAELLENAANVRTYLASLLPEKINASWQNATTWCLDFEASSLQELSRSMNGLFQTADDTRFTEAVAARDSLCIVHSYEEPVNLSFFVPNNGKTQVRYFIGNSQGGAIVPLDEQSSPCAFPAEVQDYPGYQCIINRQINQSTVFRYENVFQYQPQVLTADTSVLSLQLIDRTFTVSLGPIPQLHQPLLADAMSRDAEGYGIIRSDTSHDSFALCFTQTGTPEYLREGFRAVFHADEALEYNTAALIPFQQRQRFYFLNAQDFTGFLVNPADTRLIYTVNFRGGGVIQTDSLSTDLKLSQTEHSSYSAETAQGSVHVSMELTRSGPAWFWSLLTLFCLICAILYRIYERLMRRR